MISNYNMYIPLDGCSALINGLTGSVDLCPADVAQALEDGREMSVSVEDRIALRKRGYLTGRVSELQELQDISACLRQIAEHGSHIFFIPTYNCNLRCTYCTQHWRHENSEKWLKTVMTRETVDKAFAKALSWTGARALRGISFYGGEPLLPETRDIVEYICRTAKEQGIPIDRFTTNGYYLDKFLDLVLEYDMGPLQITLDGPRDTHDAQRFCLGGGTTFSRIVRNITNALESGAKIDVRANVGDMYTPDAEALRAMAEELGWTKHPGFKMKYSSSQETYEVVDAFYGCEPQIASDIDDAIERGCFYPLRGSFCCVQRHMWLVDPFGDLYLCQDMAGRESFRVGNVDRADSFEENTEYIDRCRERRVCVMPLCSMCKYALFCGGGCNAQSVLSDSPYEWHCGNQKEDIERRLTESLELYVEKNGAPAALTPLTRSYLEIYDALSAAELEQLRAGDTPEKLRELFR